MSFNMKNAIAGAGTGAALGPWGALGGAMLGGFMGPEQPEMYTSQNYLKDMAPYMEGVQNQMKLGNQLMNPNSAVNRSLGQNIQKTSMDQMGVANMLASRQNAANPYINTGGIQNQMVQNNLLAYANQGLGQFNQAMGQRFGMGMNQVNAANENLGSVYSNVAQINQGNMAQQAQFDQAQHQAMMSGFGTLAGDIGGSTAFKEGGLFGYVDPDKKANPNQERTPGYLSGLFNFLQQG